MKSTPKYSALPLSTIVFLVIFMSALCWVCIYLHSPFDLAFIILLAFSNGGSDPLASSSSGFLQVNGIITSPFLYSCIAVTYFLGNYYASNFQIIFSGIMSVPFYLQVCTILLRL